MSNLIAQIDILGRFRFYIVDNDLDLTPNSSKAKGLIALLATSPDMTRPRKWLEEKLWSDRAPEQASASLRQTLSEVRRSLGDYTNLIEINRKIVRFSVDEISTNLPMYDDENNIDEDCDFDFLEGLFIRDPEFTRWLSNMRSKYGASSKKQSRKFPDGLMLNCSSNAGLQSNTGIVEDIVSNQIGQNIAEQVSAWRRIGSQSNSAIDDYPQISINCHVASDNEHSAAFIQIVSSATGQLLYSKVVDIDDSPLSFIADEKLAKVTFEASEHIINKLHKSIPIENSIGCASNYAQAAVQKMFCFKNDSLAQADSYFEKAYGLDPNPMYQIWRALIRTIQSIEMFDENNQRLKDEAKLLLDEAQVTKSNNSLILSVSALVQAMLLDNHQKAVEFAQPAVDINPNSAFALQAISVAQMLSGDNASAYENSRKGRDITTNSSYHHWWDLYHSLSCIAHNRFEEALISSKNALIRAPNFRPPLRNLIALYSHFGEYEKAIETSKKLAQIEKGFSIERFVEDEAYPNRTLKNSGLLSFPVNKLM